MPAGHVVLLLIPGLLIALLNSRRRRRISLLAGVWLLASLAIWGALLRAPMYGACTLLLAVGLARLAAGRVAAVGLSPRRFRYVATSLLGLLAVLAALSSGWQALGEYRAVAALPPPPAGAGNVVLIVWDTVAAFNSSTYGYSRDTTPNLTRWARSGVKYRHARGAGPMDLPVALLFLDRPVAVSDQFPVAIPPGGA